VGIDTLEIMMENNNKIYYTLYNHTLCIVV